MALRTGVPAPLPAAWRPPTYCGSWSAELSDPCGTRGVAPRRFGNSDLTVMLHPSRCTALCGRACCCSDALSCIHAGASTGCAHATGRNVDGHMFVGCSSPLHVCFNPWRACNSTPNWTFGWIFGLASHNASDLHIPLHRRGRSDSPGHGGHNHTGHLQHRLTRRLACSLRACPGHDLILLLTRYPTRHPKQCQWLCTVSSLIPYMPPPLVAYIRASFIRHTPGQRSYCTAQACASRGERSTT